MHLLAGGAVGLAIGMTGIGGGSLMTPILVFMNYPLRLAIGTDLLYAAVTKAGGVLAHHRQGTIHWPIALLLACGSLPAATLTAATLLWVFDSQHNYSALLQFSLGIMLLGTATVLLLRPWLKMLGGRQQQERELAPPRLLTVTIGVVLGVLVTLSSVGAGAIGTAVLLHLYPKLSPSEVIGTELAHAVPLTLIAGLSHWLLLGNVDFGLLLGLLCGALPMVYLGTRISTIMPQTLLRLLLVLILGAMGLRFILI